MNVALIKGEQSTLQGQTNIIHLFSAEHSTASATATSIRGAVYHHSHRGGSEQPEGASWPFPTIPSQLGNFASAPLRFPEKMVTKQK